MIICFLRHGKADSPDSMPEEQRQLLEQGRRDIEAVATAWRRLRLRPDAIITSPRKRSVDSAELFGAPFGLQPMIAAELVPGAEWADVAALLERNRHHSVVVLVGHEPALSRSVQYLTGAKAVLLKEGGMCCVELSHTVEQSSAALTLLIDPGTCDDGGTSGR